eukprot:216234-Pleurochrysis_carterae.AAC.2
MSSRPTYVGPITTCASKLATRISKLHVRALALLTLRHSWVVRMLGTCWLGAFLYETGLGVATGRPLAPTPCERVPMPGWKFAERTPWHRGWQCMWTRC